MTGADGCRLQYQFYYFSILQLFLFVFFLFAAGIKAQFWLAGFLIFFWNSDNAGWLKLWLGKSLLLDNLNWQLWLLCEGQFQFFQNQHRRIKADPLVFLFLNLFLYLPLPQLDQAFLHIEKKKLNENLFHLFLNKGAWWQFLFWHKFPAVLWLIFLSLL